MATAAEANNGLGEGEAPPTAMDIDMPISPTTKISMAPDMQASSTINHTESLNMRADPDAQATVTDFLDFTEYLPADMMRSLTLIGKLDQIYVDASGNVDKLTTTWGKLPTLPADQRPPAVQLRANISENLNRALATRVSSYAEACRMDEYINRHVNRAKTIRAKLQIMRDNYPTEEQKSPVQIRSPQLSRSHKIIIRPDKDGQNVRRPPRITVPGEVLAPYEIDFNAYSSSSEESSEEEASLSPPRRTTPAPKIKVVANKTPKPSKQKVPKQPRPPRRSGGGGPGGNTGPVLSTSAALAQLQPPAEDAVIGSDDAPYFWLTAWELAKLRKRMKKNAVWCPSDTMIARELKDAGRGIDNYWRDKKKAEEEGRPFPYPPPSSKLERPSEGCLSAAALDAAASGPEEVQLSNRGMRLNEAKKAKRDLAKLAVQEAEESTRRLNEAALQFMNHGASPSVTGSVKEKAPEATSTSQPQGQAQAQAKAPSKSKAKKRKRDSVSEGGPGPAVKPEVTENANPNPLPKPQVKRTKTETPVPPPKLAARPTSVPPPVETPVPPPQIVQPVPVTIKSTTPVPLPVHPSSASESSAVPTRQTASPASGASPVPPPVIPTTASTSSVSHTAPSTSSTATANSAPATAATTTTTVPTKPPAETPVPPPKTSTTPIPPPTTRDIGKRETRKDTKALQPIATNIKQSTSRPNTPVTTSAPDLPSTNTRRPVSRGKAGSQEPPASLAAERPRRASTARNTPAPEIRQPSKRTKRPAPGVVATNSGGKSAVGKRKAAPRKRVRGGATKKGAANQPVEQEVEVEVDDDGNVIDPDEPRYCLCNRVSYGTMIQCENVNVDACKQEWFHLECVNLSAIPPRTTKWYCPDCRVALNIGERGEVTSRGVKI